MSFSKWIGATIGWSFGGPIGAIIGMAVGSMLDASSKGSRVRSQTQPVTRSGDFEVSLLILASIVIKADGKVSQSELDFVRRYFVQAYGKERANATFKIFNDVIKKSDISAKGIASVIRSKTRYESRLQILHFLFSIANADGAVTTSEVDMISQIAGFLSIQSADFHSIKAMFFKNPDRAYKILEIDKTATVAEIKKAYRTMVKKYHPDKLVDMDEAYKKGAEQKFREVQESYESLQKERGF